MKKGINKVIYILIIAVLLGFFMLGSSKAKYVTNEKEADSYVAKNFYFESNLLAESTKTYTYGKGKNTIEFTIYNNADELRISEVDINYTAVLTDINGNELETKNGTLASGTISTQTIKFENLSTGTYNVTVQSTAPYTKTLSGTFYITEKEESLNYEVSDIANSSILYLTINTKDYAGNVLITYPEGLQIDNTDLNIQNQTSNTITVNLKANSEYSLIFFKEDATRIYEKSNFSVAK